MDDDEIIYINPMAPDKYAAEKRRFERCGPDFFDIKFSSATGPEKWDEASIRNVSKGGIMFYSSDHYMPGSLLKVIFSDSFDKLRMVCAASVICSRYIAKAGGLYEVVIDTEKIDARVKQALIAKIESLLKNKKSN